MGILRKGKYFLKIKSVSPYVFLILVGTIISVVFLPVFAETPIEDGFESSDLNNWDGYRSSSGETIGVSSYRSYLGAYSGRVTSNGDGGLEFAYCYKKLSGSEVCFRAAYCVVNSGIEDSGDRFYLIALQSGSTTLATLGWRNVGDQVKWFLLVNGDEWVIDYSEESPQVGKWYSIVFSWKQDSVDGEASLWIGGDFWDFHEVCSISGVNTASHGDLSEVRFGLPTVSFCGETAVYFDCVDQPQYFEPVFDFDKLTRGFTLFEDGFESDFNRWSGIKSYNRGKMRVSRSSFDGRYSAKFVTRGYGQSYCYKILPGIKINVYDFGAMFKVSSCRLSEGGRVNLLRGWSGDVEVLSAGLEKIDGVVKWFFTRKGGDGFVTSYSESSLTVGDWHSLKIGLTLYRYHFEVDGVRVHSPVSPNDSSGFVDRVDVGLVKSTGCHGAVVYVDDFELNIRHAE